MRNSFIELAYQQTDPTEFHQIYSLKDSNEVLNTILRGVDSTGLDTGKAEKHVFTGQDKYMILVPFKDSSIAEQKYLISYINREDEQEFSNKILTMNPTEETVGVRISDVSGVNILKLELNSKFEPVDYEVENVVATNNFADCVAESFKRSPWFIQYGCGGACGTCLFPNPLGCTVCAGCVGGWATHCF